MANNNGAKKRIRTIAKKKVINNVYKTSMKTAIKKVDKACVADDKTVAEKALNDAIKRIDKAFSKGLVHKNTAARYKSRLTKKVNEMK